MVRAAFAGLGAHQTPCAPQQCYTVVTAAPPLPSTKVCEPQTQLQPQMQMQVQVQQAVPQPHLQTPPAQMQPEGMQMVPNLPCQTFFLQPNGGGAPQQFYAFPAMPQWSEAPAVQAASPQALAQLPPQQLQQVAPQSFAPVAGTTPLWQSQSGAAPAADSGCGKQDGQPQGYVLYYCVMPPAAAYEGTADHSGAAELPVHAECDYGDVVSGTEGEVAWYGGDGALEADAASEGSGVWGPSTAPQHGQARWSSQATQNRRQRRRRASDRSREFAQAPTTAGSLVERKAFAERVKAGLLAEEGSEARAWAVDVLLAEHPNAVEHLAFEPAGCRVVQDAMDQLDLTTASAVAAKLRGLVRSAVWSPHANHVVQKIIQSLPPQEFAFVVEELSDAPVVYAKHEYGCRVFCRLLEHAGNDELTRKMMEAVIRQTRTLCCHKFAHYVIEHALEHGTAEQRHAIATQLLMGLADAGTAPLYLAWDPSAVFVLEKAMLCASADDAAAIAGHLLLDPHAFVELAKAPQQQMLVRAVLALPGHLAARAADVLTGSADHLQKNRSGRRFVERYPSLFQGGGAAALAA